LFVGVVVFLVVLIQTAGWVGWTSGFFLYDSWPTILMVIVVIGLIGFIINSMGPKKTIPEMTGFWAQPPKPE